MTFRIPWPFFSRSKPKRPNLSELQRARIMVSAVITQARRDHKARKDLYPVAKILTTACLRAEQGRGA